jgi:hypothetical protein
MYVEGAACVGCEEMLLCHCGINASAEAALWQQCLDQFVQLGSHKWKETIGPTAALGGADWVISFSTQDAQKKVGECLIHA